MAASAIAHLSGGNTRKGVRSRPGMGKEARGLREERAGGERMAVSLQGGMLGENRGNPRRLGGLLWEGAMTLSSPLTGLLRKRDMPGF